MSARLRPPLPTCHDPEQGKTGEHEGIGCGFGNNRSGGDKLPAVIDTPRFRQDHSVGELHHGIEVRHAHAIGAGDKRVRHARRAIIKGISHYLSRIVYRLLRN